MVGREAVVGRDSVFGLRERAVDVAPPYVAGHESGEDRVRFVRGRATLLDRCDRGPRLVRHANQRRRVLCPFEAVGHDDGDGLTRIVHDVVLHREERLARRGNPEQRRD